MESLQQIALNTKPAAQISYTFHPPAPFKDTKKVLLVFLNGLGLPQSSWFPVIAKLQEQTALDLPGILTYDRYGQGATTDCDPEKPDAHDCVDVVTDLRQLLTQLTAEKLGINSLDEVRIVFVANSIGCALARLYAQEYPGTVAGLVLLDSVLANSDFVSIFPDPDAADFDQASLPENITPESLRTTRARVRAIFHPVDGQAGKAEGFSRASLPSLLPHSDGPVLLGPRVKDNGDGPFVTVVGHDFEAFARESMRMGWPVELSMAYMNPFWNAYNEGLVKITQASRAKGPVIAEGSGHFVQKDRPDLVVDEIVEILGKVYEDAQ
ncbi:Alpha/beta hydrolase fold-1 [Aspergillus falconensis]